VLAPVNEAGLALASEAKALHHQTDSGRCSFPLTSELKLLPEPYPGRIKGFVPRLTCGSAAKGLIAARAIESKSTRIATVSKPAQADHKYLRRIHGR
jgi:hypothetical protein